MVTKDKARKITDSILRLSTADEAEVSLSGGDTTHLRFARNTPSTSGTYTDPSITIRSTFGKKSGSATINQFDDDSLADGVKRSEALAKLAPEDPEFVPALGPQRYEKVSAFSERSADAGAAPLALGAAVCIKDAMDRDLVAAGFTESRARYSCLANSRGVFGYHQSTGAYAAETVRTEDASGSGWASTAANDILDIDYASLSRAAYEKAIASKQPQALEPGKYVTILEPACVANLVGNMVYSMSARSADEGRSYFAAPAGGNRIGEKLFGSDIDIESNPTDERVPGSPWGGGGVPQRPRKWIEGGVVKTLSYSRYWAQKNGVEPIPGPSNIIMSGGTGSVADLIASTDRGVLVTSLWYIRSTDPQTMSYTGLTRDGVFLIEDGKITAPVTNFRWNDSPIAVLKNIEAMSAPVRMPPRPRRSNSVIVPALRVSEFNLSSVSEAV
jgi:predicted Zn-dependent protease